MASFNDFLKKLFGSKADRDMKAIRPTLEKVLKEYSRIDILSDDQLREETDKLRAIINKKIAKELEDKKDIWLEQLKYKSYEN